MRSVRLSNLSPQSSQRHTYPAPSCEFLVDSITLAAAGWGEGCIGWREGEREGERERDDARKKLLLVEFTVCFETTFDDAAQRKRARYAELQQSARDAGYQTAIATLEVGSRGIINYCRFSSLKKHLQIRERELGALLQSLSVEALLQSFRIWCLRNHQP